MAKIKRKERQAAKARARSKTNGQPMSNHGRRVCGQLKKLKRKQKRRRENAAHQHSRKLADRAHTVVLEDLNTKAMTRSAKGTVEEPGQECEAEVRAQPRDPEVQLGPHGADAGLQGGAGTEGSTCLHVADLCGVRTRQQGESQDTGTLPMHGVRTHCERGPQCRPKHPGAGLGPVPDGPRDRGCCTARGARSLSVACGDGQIDLNDP